MICVFKTLIDIIKITTTKNRQMFGISVDTLPKGVRIIYKFGNTRSVTKHIESLHIVTIKIIGFIFPFLDARKI